MSYSDYSGPPSRQFNRTPSIDPTKHVSYAPPEAAPNFSNQFPATSERSIAPDQVFVQAPGEAEIREMVNSSKDISGGFSTRGPGQTRFSDWRAPGLSGTVHENLSGNNVGGGGGGDVGAEPKAPTVSDYAGNRERSNNGEPGEGGGSVDPMDYVGISLVGKKFKQVNPEAYYVENDD